MKFYEFGDKNAPHILLIHGAGWSWWLYLRQARLLQEKYHIILPVLDGHGEESESPYSSTEEEADKILNYIDETCDGKLYAISGVSLGGQIAIELLSRRPELAKKAIIESGLCIPQPLLMKYSIFVCRYFGKWMFSEKLNQWGLKHLPKRLKLPKEIEDLYMRDITCIKPKTFLQVFKTYYQYSIKHSFRNCSAEVIYWYGGKEMKCIKNSAVQLQAFHKYCSITELPDYIHAEISTYHPEEWVERAEKFFLT